MASAIGCGCTLCGGTTTSCDVLKVLECHGKKKVRMGVSRIRCKVESRVCVECGYLMFFAATPRPFRQEIDLDAAHVDALPIAAGPEPNAHLEG